MGVIRFLADAGKLQDVTHICSVSGGSILAAHLVLNWDRYTGGQFDAAAAEILDFARSDVRGRVFRRWILGLVAFPFLRLGPWPWKRRWTRTVLLQEEYDRLYRHELLRSLAVEFDDPAENPRPQVFLLATAMKTGDMCTFTGRGLQFEEARLSVEDAEHRERPVDGTLLPISFAVTASSAFPPAFPPVKVTHQLLRTDAAQFPHSPEYLSDGGVFDNLGIRKLQNLQSHTAFDLSALVVSDAEAPFVWQVGAGLRAFSAPRRAVQRHPHETGGEPGIRLGDAAAPRAGIAGVPLLHLGRGRRPARPGSRVGVRHAADPHRSGSLLRPGDTVLVEAGLHGGPQDAAPGRGVCRTRAGGDPRPHAAAVGTGAGRRWAECRRAECRRAECRRAECTRAGPAPGGGSSPDHALLRGRSAAPVRQEVDEIERRQTSPLRWVLAVFDPRDWISWITLCLLLLYAGAGVGSWFFNFVRATQTAGWERDFRTYRDAFQENWRFQIVYLPIADVFAQLDPATQAVVRAGPEQAAEGDKAAAGSYQRLEQVAGLESEAALAYVSCREVLGGAGRKLFTGFIPRFAFPGRKDELLIQFSGSTAGPAGDELPLEFFQYKLAEIQGEADGQAASGQVANFTVEFRQDGPSSYTGELTHPLLKNREQKEVSIATVRLWKPAGPRRHAGFRNVPVDVV